MHHIVGDTDQLCFDDRQKFSDYVKEFREVFTEMTQILHKSYGNAA